MTWSISLSPQRALGGGSSGAFDLIGSMRTFKYFYVIISLMLVLCSLSCSSKVYNVNWNTSNPIFRIDNTDHIIDVNRDNLPYDQVNIICPVYAPGTSEEEAEKYIIYNVSKEEYDTCRITNPNPRIIAVCDKPYRTMYFTITFRSFTPQPGGLEFRPGQDYYFISTSSRDDLHRRVGGRCLTHNMKVVFKVCCHPGDNSSTPQGSAPASGTSLSPPSTSSSPSGGVSPSTRQNSSSLSHNTNNNNNNNKIIINTNNNNNQNQQPAYSPSDNTHKFTTTLLPRRPSIYTPSPTSIYISSTAPYPQYPYPSTRYPKKPQQYNPKPTSKKKLEKHPNEVLKNEELTSSSTKVSCQLSTTFFVVITSIFFWRIWPSRPYTQL